jgi:hypothetical protein
MSQMGHERRSWHVYSMSGLPLIATAQRTWPQVASGALADMPSTTSNVRYRGNSDILNTS